MTQQSEEISAPVTDEGPQEKDHASTLVSKVILWAIGLFVAFTLMMNFLVARDAAKRAQRSQSLLKISQGMTNYEQAFGVSIATLPDWKKALIDSGFVSEEVFESRDSANGQIDYLLMSRPEDQRVSGLPSWIAVCEDPRSLDDPRLNLWVIFVGDSHAVPCTRRELLQNTEQACQHLRLPFDSSAWQHAFSPVKADSK